MTDVRTLFNARKGLVEYFVNLARSQILNVFQGLDSSGVVKQLSPAPHDFSGPHDVARQRDHRRRRQGRLAVASFGQIQGRVGRISHFTNHRDHAHHIQHPMQPFHPAARLLGLGRWCRCLFGLLLGEALTRPVGSQRPVVVVHDGPHRDALGRDLHLDEAGRHPVAARPGRGGALLAGLERQVHARAVGVEEADGLLGGFGGVLQEADPAVLLHGGRHHPLVEKGVLLARRGERAGDGPAQHGRGGPPQRVGLLVHTHLVPIQGVRLTAYFQKRREGCHVEDVKLTLWRKLPRRVKLGECVCLYIKRAGGVIRAVLVRQQNNRYVALIGHKPDRVYTLYRMLQRRHVGAGFQAAVRVVDEQVIGSILAGVGLHDYFI